MAFDAGLGRGYTPSHHYSSARFGQRDPERPAAEKGGPMGSSSHLPGKVAWIAAAAATALSLAVPSAASGSSGATGVAIPRSSGGVRSSQPVGMQVAAGPFSGHLGISGDGLGT